MSHSLSQDVCTLARLLLESISPSALHQGWVRASARLMRRLGLTVRSFVIKSFASSVPQSYASISHETEGMLAHPVLWQKFVTAVSDAVLKNLLNFVPKLRR